MTHRSSNPEKRIKLGEPLDEEGNTVSDPRPLDDDFNPISDYRKTDKFPFRRLER